MPEAFNDLVRASYQHRIQDALHEYVKSEQLTGNNQYLCERCAGKQDTPNSCASLKCGAYSYAQPLLKRWHMVSHALHFLQLLLPVAKQTNEYVHLLFTAWLMPFRSS